MPRKPQKSKRKDMIPLDDTIKAVLFFWLDAKVPRDSAGWSLRAARFFVDGEDEIRRTWEQHKKALFSEWKKSGQAGLPWAAKRFS